MPIFVCMNTVKVSNIEFLEPIHIGLNIEPLFSVLAFLTRSYSAAFSCAPVMLYSDCRLCDLTGLVVVPIFLLPFLTGVSPSPETKQKYNG